MSDTFQPGEVVNVAIRGVQYRIFDESAAEHEVQTPTGARYRLPPGALIQRIAPKEWPPESAEDAAARDGES